MWQHEKYFQIYVICPFKTLISLTSILLNWHHKRKWEANKHDFLRHFLRGLSLKGYSSCGCMKFYILFQILLWKLQTLCSFLWLLGISHDKNNTLQNWTEFKQYTFVCEKLLSRLFENCLCIVLIRAIWFGLNIEELDI